MNAAQRRCLELEATKILAANPEPRPTVTRIRYRGTRPAITWLSKRDPEGAAALWLIARERLPLEAANDNEPSKGMVVDRNKDGRARGPRVAPRNLAAYLALPGVKPRLGDAPAEPARRTGWWNAAGFAIKPQIEEYQFHRDCRFGFCAPAIADGAIFLGAIGGSGAAKAGKLRGDRRRVDGGDPSDVPTEVDTVIEAALAGGNVADVGRALGAKGGYADRRGGAALRAAGAWAKVAVAA